MSGDLNAFVLDISKWRVKTEKQLEAIVKKVAFELFTLVVRRSPVDTGRFRANNQISINSLPKSVEIDWDKNGTATIGKGKGKLGQYKLGDVVYIYNNVAYAVALEHGHSKQAPEGVYRISVEDLIQYLEHIIRGASKE